MSNAVGDREESGVAALNRSIRALAARKQRLETAATRSCKPFTTLYHSAVNDSSHCRRSVGPQRSPASASLTSSSADIVVSSFPRALNHSSRAMPATPSAGRRRTACGQQRCDGCERLRSEVAQLHASLEAALWRADSIAAQNHAAQVDISALHDRICELSDHNATFSRHLMRHADELTPPTGVLDRKSHAELDSAVVMWLRIAQDEMSVRMRLLASESRAWSDLMIGHGRGWVNAASNRVAPRVPPRGVAATATRGPRASSTAHPSDHRDKRPLSADTESNCAWWAAEADIAPVDAAALLYDRCAGGPSRDSPDFERTPPSADGEKRPVLAARPELAAGVSLRQRLSAAVASLRESHP